MKQRLVADPCIGVGDLLQCVEAFLDEAGDNGLQAHLQPPANMNWKTAPNPAWLCRLSNLWRKYLALAPNAVIPSKKHRLALEKLQERRSGVNTGKKNQQDFAEACDEWIRIGLSHLRFLKQSDINRSRCFRKCDPDEVATLETVLGSLLRSMVKPMTANRAKEALLQLQQTHPSSWPWFHNQGLLQLQSRPQLGRKIHWPSSLQ